MKIDNKNGKLINTKKINIHDNIIKKNSYDMVKKCITLKLEDGQKKETCFYEIKFINVIGFEMTACDYWGAYYRILDFEYMGLNERSLIPKLYLKGNENLDRNLKKKNPEEFMEIVITFASGDSLTIACESIDFMKEIDNEE